MPSVDAHGEGITVATTVALAPSVSATLTGAPIVATPVIVGPPGPPSTVPGPAGPPGAPGQPGPPGGNLGAPATFMLSSTTVEPPTGAQMRFDSSNQALATKMWVVETTTDNLDVAVGFGRIGVGYQIYMQDYDDSTRWATYDVTAAGIDKGAYWEFGISRFDASASALPYQKLVLQTIFPGKVSLPSGGTAEQVLTKNSSADFDASWQTITPIVVQSTQPTAADYGLPAIPVGAIWIQA